MHGRQPLARRAGGRAGSVHLCQGLFPVLYHDAGYQHILAFKIVVYSAHGNAALPRNAAQGKHAVALPQQRMLRRRKYLFARLINNFRHCRPSFPPCPFSLKSACGHFYAVSYTHLTLPTNSLV